MQGQAPRARVPLGPGGVVPQTPVEGPGPTPVLALEKRRGGHARPQHSVRFPGVDDPDQFHACVRVLGKGQLGLLPLLGLRLVGQVQVRAVLSVGHGRVVRAGARVPQCEFRHDPAESPRRHLHGPSALAAQHEQPLARPHQQLGVRSSRDGRQDVDAVALRHARVGTGTFAVEEHVHVGADPSPFVQHPSGQLRELRLQPSDDLADGPPVHADGAGSTGQVPQRGAQGDLDHAPIIGQAPRSRERGRSRPRPPWPARPGTPPGSSP